MDGSLEAQLRATLNMVPAYTWYAAPSGGLTFVNERAADYGGLPSDHPLRYGTDTSAAWDSHIPFLHPEDQEETRRVTSLACSSCDSHASDAAVAPAWSSRIWVICSRFAVRAQSR